MSKGIFETIGGGLLAAGGVALDVVTGGAATPLAAFMIKAGAGLLIAGIGTMIAGTHAKGFATTIRDPISPWQVVYGRARVGGTLVYIAEFGQNNRFLDMVIVLACHPCESVDTVLFDGQLLQIGKNNSSFTPPTPPVNIHLTSEITRDEHGVVNVTLERPGGSGDIPLLKDGDYVLVNGVEPASTMLDGKFQVFNVQHTVGTPPTVCSFQYLSGGPPTSGAGSIPVTASGQVIPAWQNYGANVYVETINDSGPYNLIGYTVAGGGSTFRGMLDGTPLQGSFSNGNIQNNSVSLNGNSYPSSNPWTGYHSLIGFCSVFLRLQYDPNIFPGGIPQISFLMRGKCDILDPRNSPPTRSYTENAALIIADYLAQPTYGFTAPADNLEGEVIQ